MVKHSDSKCVFQVLGPIYLKVGLLMAYDNLKLYVCFLEGTKHVVKVSPYLY